MPAKRKVILYIAASLDGYIAKPDGDIRWLSQVEMPDEDYGYHAFIKTVDTIIMGRKTYDKVLTLVPEYPHLDKKSYIITRTAQSTEGNLVFYTGSLKGLVEELKSKPGKNIYVDGGGEIVNAMLEDGLIDEFIISVIPVLLGGGIRLFNAGWKEQKLQVLDCKGFQSGLIQMHYARV